MDNVTIEEVRDFNVHIGLSNASRERRETVLLLSCKLGQII